MLSPRSAAMRRMRGPTVKARIAEPMAAEPTHHQAAIPSRYPRPAAPTVEPAPMLAATMVEKSRPGPSARPATKKSPLVFTRRPIHRPTATCRTQ